MSQKVDNPIKCGYCGYIMTGFLNKLLDHSCYQAIYNKELHEFSLDDAGMLIIVNKVSMNEQETSVEGSSGCISGEVDGNELNEVGDVEDDEISGGEYDDYDDMMKNDPSGKKLGKAVEVYGPFASGKYDESLIGQVQPKPALYDSRLPAKQRAKKVKADLWKLISNSFGGGEFTPVYACRRWAYLRGCYCKARNKLMKEKAAFERSGAASSDIKSSYRYYEAMSFLNEPLTYKSTISSLKLKRKNANNTSNKENMELKKSRQTPVHSNTFKERFVRPTSALSNISSTINTVALESPTNDSEQRCVSLISQSAIMSEVSPSTSAISTVSRQTPPNTPHDITQIQSFSPSNRFSTGAQPQRVFQQKPISNVLVSRQAASKTLFPSSNDHIQDPPSQEQSSGSKKRRTTDLEMEMIKILKKEPKEMDEIDNFAMRLAAGMRRLSYKSRAKLEIEFLTRLQEEDDLQAIDTQ